jgi:hypothetical protein
MASGGRCVLVPGPTRRGVSLPGIIGLAWTSAGGIQVSAGRGTRTLEADGTGEATSGSSGLAATSTRSGWAWATTAAGGVGGRSWMMMVAGVPSGGSRSRLVSTFSRCSSSIVRSDWKTHSSVTGYSEASVPDRSAA